MLPAWLLLSAYPAAGGAWRFSSNDSSGRPRRGIAVARSERSGQHSRLRACLPPWSRAPAPATAVSWPHMTSAARARSAGRRGAVRPHFRRL